MMKASNNKNLFKSYCGFYACFWFIEMKGLEMVKCKSLRINMLRITHTGKWVNFPVTVFSASWIYFKFTGGLFWGSSLPLLQKMRITWNEIFQSKPRGLLGDRTCKYFNRTKSSVWIAGLCSTFLLRGALSLQLWHLASRLTFYTLSRKIASGLCSVAVHSSIFQLRGEIKGA